KSGQIGVVMKLSSSGEAGVCFAGDGGLQSPAEASQLLQDTEVVVIARPARAIPDARVDAYNSPYDKNWFRKIVLRDIRPYGHILLASLIANTLGLAGIIFSMQVYDRVVPSQSYHTLYVLFCG
ncbi:type I secretion system permease/ATPase, partial [Ochrobactrum sp. MR34]|nr:type I secretion system permease/ATPase [Ochrobactrum sp. MR34]